MKRIEIVAEVAGKVWKIAVRPGVQLAADGTIFILESMKMEIPVVTPLAGKLIELHVAEGDSVLEGDVVAAVAVSG